MQGDALHDKPEGVTWDARVRSLTQRAARVQAVRDQVVLDLAAREREVEAMTARLNVLAKVGELFRVLLDKLVLDHVRSLENVVTDALRTIFFDQQLSFEAEIVHRRDRVNIDFYISTDGGKDRLQIRGNPLESFGGGPSIMASLILRMLAMLRLKKWPILLLDETLSAVGESYIEKTSEFLDKLSKSMGISILLVTHKPEFVDCATSAYQGSEHVMEDGSKRLQLHHAHHRGAP